MPELGLPLPPRGLGIEQAAQYLGVGPTTVRALISTGKLRTFRLPGIDRRLIDRADLDLLIEAAKADAS